MPQIRIEKKDHFTRIDNGLIQNPEISLKAKGLLAYMLSLPDDWDYSISGLSVKCKEGKSSIRSAITELMEHRYITRSLARGENGRLGGYEYVVYEEPQPSCENQTSDNQSSDNQSSENRTQQTNNSTNEKKTNTPYSPPGGDGAPAEPAPEDRPARKSKPSRREKSMPDYDPEAFEIFWSAYPRKDGRKAAIRAWDKLRPDKPLCRAMYDALRRQRRSEQWAEEGGRFIPHFSTWLNQRKWEDQGVDLSLLDRTRDASGYWAPDPEVTT